MFKLDLKTDKNEDVFKDQGNGLRHKSFNGMPISVDVKQYKVNIQHIILDLKRFKSELSKKNNLECTPIRFRNRLSRSRLRRKMRKIP